MRNAETLFDDSLLQRTDVTTLDFAFIHVMRALALEAKSGRTERFASAPRLAPRRRLDETRAARKPILRWTPKPLPQAAE